MAAEALSPLISCGATEDERDAYCPDHPRHHQISYLEEMEKHGHTVSGVHMNGVIL